MPETLSLSFGHGLRTEMYALAGEIVEVVQYYGGRRFKDILLTRKELESALELLDVKLGGGL